MAEVGTKAQIFIMSERIPIQQGFGRKHRLKRIPVK